MHGNPRSGESRAAPSDTSRPIAGTRSPEGWSWRHELEVHGRPRQPREKAADLHTSRSPGPRTLADHRHIALIEVPERTRERVCRRPGGESACRRSVLAASPPGRRQAAACRPARAMRYHLPRRSPGGPGTLRSGWTLDPSRAIRLHLQPLAGRDGATPAVQITALLAIRSPAEDDPFCIDLIDSVSQPHLHTQALEPFLRGPERPSANVPSTRGATDRPE